MDDQLHRTILQFYPHAMRLIDIQSFRPGYLPYPARVTIQTTTGQEVACVLKVSVQAEKLILEARVLQALADLQLAVPQILAGPVTIQSEPTPVTVLLMSELPGHALPWIALTDLATADRTCQLVHAAVDQLHALTPHMMAHPVAALIPARTLESELLLVRERRGTGFDMPLFNDALALVQAALPRFNCPLVFSNGDYNPLNFLTADGALVGWIDFEHACFEDPYIGFAKFFLWADDAYGWGVGAKVGLVERYLYAHHVAPAAFLVRLVLRGLYHLQDAAPTQSPDYMLHVVTDAVHKLRQALDA